MSATFCNTQEVSAAAAWLGVKLPCDETDVQEGYCRRMAELNSMATSRTTVQRQMDDLRRKTVEARDLLLSTCGTSQVPSAPAPQYRPMPASSCWSSGTTWQQSRSPGKALGMIGWDCFQAIGRQFKIEILEPLWQWASPRMKKPWWPIGAGVLVSAGLVLSAVMIWSWVPLLSAGSAGGSAAAVDDAEDGPEVNQAVAPPQAMALLTIRTYPWASCEIGDLRANVPSPRPFPLSVGRHLIRLEAPQKPPITVPVIVQAGADAILRVDLVTGHKTIEGEGVKLE